MSTDMRAEVVGLWQRWRGPVVPDGLHRWIALGFMVGLLELVPGLVEPPLEAEAPRKEEDSHPHASSPRRGGPLSQLVQDAPPQFCCALDGQLMMDPVETPKGFIFEREALVRALHAQQGWCPKTGEPLNVADCRRLPELRRKILYWVRSQKAS
eukprot:TRINITY_DN48065_c0_g1_i1.p1 TRINITY_DN48065_c0_g1~~TRINITY_DN48065_c0_g1_i1.p1  ORF type:complete len:174 (-),score=39.81 TRINITY_DN48065_c0_g1_i1:54-515(-)